MFRASIGIALGNAALAGYYGARSTSSYCLESLAKLETPMGGELAVIFARRCPECDIARSSPWADAIRGTRGRPSGAARLIFRNRGLTYCSDLQLPSYHLLHIIIIIIIVIVVIAVMTTTPFS